ncbi:MAG: hypothetical protein KIT72_05925 [Polyangiaceae bacterium]|nr:hypothetical protein [Polyangiaceae bacterium]MCW5789938.1 hypothetical protein [Polyangiaceae bacterium]
MNDPLLETYWKQVLDRWDDDRAHGAFLKHCQEHQALAEAAARYKGMTGDRERGEAARKRLGAVALLAMATLDNTPRTVPSRLPRHIALGLSVLFVVGALILLSLS